MICEPLYLAHELLFPTFELPNPQDLDWGEYQFSFSLPSLRGFDRYLQIAAATLLFYDFLLTLADEVSHAIGVFTR